jgi:hypothetical protein
MISLGSCALNLVLRLLQWLLELAPAAAVYSRYGSRRSLLQISPCITYLSTTYKESILICYWVNCIYVCCFPFLPHPDKIRIWTVHVHAIEMPIVRERIWAADRLKKIRTSNDAFTGIWLKKTPMICSLAARSLELLGFHFLHGVRFSANSSCC